MGNGHHIEKIIYSLKLALLNKSNFNQLNVQINYYPDNAVRPVVSDRSTSSSSLALELPLLAQSGLPRWPMTTIVAVREAGIS